MTSYQAKIEQEHLSCITDADCVLIGQGSCCGQDVAINKKFKDKLQKSPEDRCQTMNVLCSQVEVTCEKNLCSFKKQH